MNILTLGNSITNGTDRFNSYRRALWKRLDRDSYNVDFIGSWSLHHMGQPVPDPDFDMDHEGHSGWTARDMLNPPAWDSTRGNLNQWLYTYRPDIVIIELGTNEVFQCVNRDTAMKNLSDIIETLRRSYDSVKILLAQIPPLGPKWTDKKLCGTDTAYGLALTLFNESLLLLKQQSSTSVSPVLLVDQFNGMNPSTDMYDDIHPNEKGETKMAKKWFIALKPFLRKTKK